MRFFMFQVLYHAAALGAFHLTHPPASGRRVVTHAVPYTASQQNSYTIYDILNSPKGKTPWKPVASRLPCAQNLPRRVSSSPWKTRGWTPRCCLRLCHLRGELGAFGAGGRHLAVAPVGGGPLLTLFFAEAPSPVRPRAGPFSYPGLRWVFIWPIRWPCSGWLGDVRTRSNRLWG